MYSYNHIFDIEVEKKESRVKTGIDKNGLKQCQSICYQLKVPLESVVDDHFSNSRFVEICTSNIGNKKSPKWERWGMRDKWLAINSYIQSYQWITNQHISHIQDMLKQNKLNDVELTKTGEIHSLNIIIDGKYNI
jgi:hypothetical protein